MNLKIGVIGLCLLLFQCNRELLSIVTVKQFATFVEETGYVTDAERFKWSFEQITVDSFRVVKHVNWRNAYPENLHTDDYPVVQVSYNDAIAYTEWSKTFLPSFEEYWEFTKHNKGTINSGGTTILSINECNIIGNTWEITNTIKNGEVRLAGGSYLCNQSTCKGTSPERELYVDQFTGNSHIGFAIIK